MDQNTSLLPIWITGSSRTGKSTKLIEKLVEFAEKISLQKSEKNISKPILVFSVNRENRSKLFHQYSQINQNNHPTIIFKTFLGFIEEEVKLFYPLICQELNLKSPFPLKLRPETEQELATVLWKSDFTNEELVMFGGEYRLVRIMLDLGQLSAAAGIALEKMSSKDNFLAKVKQVSTEGIGNLLKIGLDDIYKTNNNQNYHWQKIENLLLKWQNWCLKRGFLTYALIYDLYWRYLLTNPLYLEKLISRYQGIFADDTDDYPAISGDFFHICLNHGLFGVFTYNPDGKVRLGLNADPNYLVSLADRCQIESLDDFPEANLALKIGNSILNSINEGELIDSNCRQYLPLISEVTRASLLRKIADKIIDSINSGEIKASEIVIIAPGLDDIGRYTLINILENNGIKVDPLHEQFPLISSSLVRALLTLLALVYPGLGVFVLEEAIAEMLVVLSSKYSAKIDPIRAGLLADYCYNIDLESPHLLSVEDNYERWDRIGYEALKAYNYIKDWIEGEKIKRESDLDSKYTPITLLDSAINNFFKHKINYSELASLRELIETAQHFWQVKERLKIDQNDEKSQTKIIGEFIEMLQKGTITANPYPIKPNYFNPNDDQSIILANIYQYRTLRSQHKWHFWLDIGSNLWQKSGTSELFGAPLFLREWDGKPLNINSPLLTEKERLNRILRDLLARVTDKVFLCYSQFNINGVEENGKLQYLITDVIENS